MYSVHEWTSVFLFVFPVNSGIITVHARNLRNVSLCNINGKVRWHPTILVCFSKFGWFVSLFFINLLYSVPLWFPPWSAQCPRAPNRTLYSTFVVSHHDLPSVLELLIVLYTVSQCMVPHHTSYWCSTMLSSVPRCLTAGFVGSDAVLSCLWYMYDSGEKIAGWERTICYCSNLLPLLKYTVQ